MSSFSHFFLLTWAEDSGWAYRMAAPDVHRCRSSSTLSKRNTFAACKQSAFEQRVVRSSWNLEDNSNMHKISGEFKNG